MAPSLLACLPFASIHQPSLISIWVTRLPIWFIQPSFADFYLPTSLLFSLGLPVPHLLLPHPSSAAMPWSTFCPAHPIAHSPTQCFVKTVFCEKCSIWMDILLPVGCRILHCLFFNCLLFLRFKETLTKLNSIKCVGPYVPKRTSQKIPYSFWMMMLLKCGSFSISYLRTSTH